MRSSASSPDTELLHELKRRFLGRLFEILNLFEFLPCRAAGET